MLCQKIRHYALLILVGPLLAACATGFRADVTRFHVLTPAAGESVTIEPAEGIEMGPEFTSYANMVGDRLAAEGYRPAAGEAANIIATLAYAIRETGAAEDKGPQVGVGMGQQSGNVGIGLGTSFSLGGGPKPVFLYEVVVILTAADSGERLFEGRATSRGTEATLGAVMPELVTALFVDFPGVSGESRQVRLKPDG